MGARESELYYATRPEPKPRLSKQKYDNAAYCRRYREKNPGKAAEYARRRRAKDPEGKRAQQRGIYARNPEPSRQRAREWRKANPGKVAAYSRNRELLKRGATPPAADQAAIMKVYELAARMRRLLGGDWHVDHVIPLSKGGLHHQDNLVVMRSDLNRQKHDHIIPELIRFFTPFDVPAD